MLWPPQSTRLCGGRLFPYLNREGYRRLLHFLKSRKRKIPEPRGRPPG
jgi:hypothetical protein